MTHVGRIERGASHPTLNKLEALAQVMNVHPLTVLALSYVASPKPEVVQSLLAQITSEIQDLRIDKFSGTNLSPGVKPAEK